MAQECPGKVYAITGVAPIKITLRICEGLGAILKRQGLELHIRGSLRHVRGSLACAKAPYLRHKARVLGGQMGEVPGLYKASRDQLPFPTSNSDNS